ncbi:MAG TPA: hypothetical protein DGA22_02875 [Acidobacterium sp.]|nr:hypothetical protein [Acidobacterium sp.]
MNPPAAPSKKPISTRTLWFAFSTALTLRLLFLFGFHLYTIHPWTDHFQFGWEMGRIARSLVTGHGYSSPFGGYTGPSAWTAPLYPFFIAAVFRLFGIYSQTSALVLMLWNVLFDALAVFPLWHIARRSFGLRTARASVWMWAICPFTFQYIPRIWVSTLAMLLFAMIFALMLRMRGIGEAPQPLSATATPRRWLLFGLLWGVLALGEASCLLCLPVSLIWLLLPAWREPGRSQLRGMTTRAAASVAIIVACMTPWMIRNTIAFHRFIPMRTDLGLELAIGNGPGAEGLPLVYDHPSVNPVQFRLYSRLGEIEYCRERGSLAKSLIRTNPAHYAADTLRRIDFYWFGVPPPSNPNILIQYLPTGVFAFFGLCGLAGLALALHNKAPAASLMAFSFLLLPLLYYFVFVEDRFRYTLDPLIYCLTAYLWLCAEEGYRVRWLTPGWWRSHFPLSK